MRSAVAVLGKVMHGVCSVAGIRSGTPQPRYTVLDTIGGGAGAIEIRRYGDRLAAESVENGDEIAARSAGFRRLAGFIFGGNRDGTRIAMTSPVAQGPADANAAGHTDAPTATPAGFPTDDRGGAGADTPAGARADVRADVRADIVADAQADARPDAQADALADTSPGFRRDATAPTPEKRSSIRFFLPDTLTVDRVPAPRDPAIRILRLPPETVAVLRFAGTPGVAVVAERKRTLLAALASARWRPVAVPVAWFYDPPWTLPPLRRNEVAVVVAPRP